MQDSSRPTERFLRLTTMRKFSVVTTPHDEHNGRPRTRVGPVKAALTAVSIVFGLAAIAMIAYSTYAAASTQSAMIERLLPSVVRITVHKLQNASEQGLEESYGSGFIVDRTGFIITNQHVVEGAYEIIVTLNDGVLRHAKLVGTGGDIDLALLKIEARSQLQPLVFGDSEALKVADEVFAIGNPYGIGTTVTRGIVSAVNRDLSRSPFDSYIQTDAAINKGNSGGPLVNGKGEVIGVNAAYYRGMVERGGSIGLGFAIPSEVAKAAIDLIRQFGYLKFGWLGVDGQTMTAEMAGALGIDYKTGAIIIAVRNDGPSAGLLEADDIILEVDGKKLLDMRMLQRAAVSALGKAVRLKVLRQNVEQYVVVTATERPFLRASPAPQSTTASGDINSFGLALTALTASRRRELAMSDDAAGVSIVSVAPISAAAEAGLSNGEVIESIQFHPMRTEKDVASALSALATKKQDFALIRVRSRDRTRFVVLHLIWEGPNSARQH